MVRKVQAKTPVTSLFWSVGSVFWMTLVIISLASCALKPSKAPPPVNSRVFPEFVAVISGPNDTFSSLAQTYLNDASMDWFISEFNRSKSLRPGQELIIPLRPYDKGGIAPNGYQTVPVLCYHKFSKAESDRMTVTQNSFEAQMRFLKQRGYRVITLDALFEFLDFRRQIPKKSVVITIDDGWRSAYDIAFPILKKYGYPATLFVYTDLIVGSRKTLNWDLIREMARNGIDMQCHTRTHRDLSRREGEESFRAYFEAVEKELNESARIMNKELNREVKYLAYPFGATNSMVVAVVRKLGYEGAFTVERGGNPFFIDRYQIFRSQIYGHFDIHDFEKNLKTFRSFGRN